MPPRTGQSEGIVGGIAHVKDTSCPEICQHGPWPPTMGPFSPHVQPRVCRFLPFRV